VGIFDSELLLEQQVIALVIGRVIPRPGAKRKRKPEMSSEKIEFVKPPVNSSKDKKLAGVGVGLVLLGLI
jgi:hypothetical protein